MVKGGGGWWLWVVGGRQWLLIILVFSLGPKLNTVLLKDFLPPPHPLKN